jgi:hypothetical protein
MFVVHAGEDLYANIDAVVDLDSVPDLRRLLFPE